MVASIKRKARLNALKATQDSIIKEGDSIGFFKGIFSDFSNSIKSQVDPNRPVLSALNFISVGIIASYSPILGIILSILGSSFGINFKTIFLSIQNSLSKLLETEDGKNNLSTNSDSVLKDVVNNAFDSSVQVTDEQINYDQFNESFFSSASNEQIKLIKEAAIGAALVQRILPKIGTIFGKGKGGIKAFIFWVVKAALLGAGLIGGTGAVAKLFSKDQSESKTPEQHHEQTHSDYSSSSSTSSTSSTSNESRGTILQELKLSPSHDIVVRRENNAPNDQEMGSSGGYEWTVSGPLAETLYNWVFKTYRNSNEIFRKHNITPSSLKQASEQISNEFMNKTRQKRNEFSYRIPKEYDNVKDVVDLIISRAAKLKS